MKNKKLFWLFGLNSSVYFLQGINSIALTPLNYYLKETLHLSPSIIMYITAFTSLAWLVKPIIGMIIDSSKLERRTWILIALLIDVLASLFLGLYYLPLGFLVTVLMMTNWNSAWRDVSVDGIMVCEGQKRNICDKLQSWQWIAITFAGILATLVGSIYAEKNISYQIGFLTLIPFYVIGLLTTLKYKEEKSCKPKVNFNNYKVLFKNKNFLFGCLFLFLYKFSPSFGTPLWYIERDTFHFSRLFIGILGVLGSLISIVGAIYFSKISKKINFRNALIWSIFLGGFFSLAYLYFTPITDIIYTLVLSAIGMFFHLLIMTWMANNCIKGLESTSFAFLCSISNISGTASLLTGAWLLPLIGLKWLIIASAISSFICLPLLKKLEIK